MQVTLRELNILQDTIHYTYRPICFVGTTDINIKF